MMKIGLTSMRLEIETLLSLGKIQFAICDFILLTIPNISFMCWIELSISIGQQDTEQYFAAKKRGLL